MPSVSVDRRLLVKLLLALNVASLQWLVVLMAPFYFPADGYQVDRYYYNVPTQSDSWAQPSQNGYYYSHPSNTIAPISAQSENVDNYNGRFNYYGVPRYEDYRKRQDNRYIWNDPYIRRQWKNYFQGYYYPSASASSWNGRRDGSTYYRRRQDSPDTTTAATTTASLRPSVPRKKKLFVPNVWG
uniref:Uncharacterized protein n=1 Tax=Anopheles atroparvus TaxID=41427 RepID=A0A182JHE4_ANOAO